MPPIVNGAKLNNPGAGNAQALTYTGLVFCKAKMQLDLSCDYNLWACHSFIIY